MLGYDLEGKKRTFFNILHAGGYTSVLGQPAGPEELAEQVEKAEARQA